ncbi:MAG: DUF5689 domain-containing protein [Alistipes putredinis]|nr:MAG: DUF5689 domain-containing protein [Alistipes putredinis]
MKRIILFVLSLCMACSHGYDPPPRGEEAMPNITIAELIDRLGGEAVTVSDSAVVEGRVTATDMAGNFYREFVMDDGSGAMAVMAGGYDLHSVYPRGIKVIVKLCGLKLAARDGVLRCGLPPAPGSSYEIDYMQHRAVCDRYIVRTADSSAVTPVQTEIGEINRSLYGRLVRIRSLHYADTLPVWYSESDYLDTSLRKFKDRAGDSIYVITNRYAVFAGKRVPSDAAFTGILYHDGKRPMLKLRDEKDIDFR